MKYSRVILWLQEGNTGPTRQAWPRCPVWTKDSDNLVLPVPNAHLRSHKPSGVGSKAGCHVSQVSCLENSECPEFMYCSHWDRSQHWTLGITRDFPLLPPAPFITSLISELCKLFPFYTVISAFPFTILSISWGSPRTTFAQVSPGKMVPVSREVSEASHPAVRNS